MICDPLSPHQHVTWALQNFPAELHSTVEAFLVACEDLRDDSGIRMLLSDWETWAALRALKQLADLGLLKPMSREELVQFRKERLPYVA